MILFALIGLISVPIAAYVWAKSYRPKFTAAATGASLGLVIVPVSMGLYSTYFLGPFGIVTGMLALISVLFHGSPGYYLSVYLGIVPEGTVVEGIRQLYVVAIDGVFWAIIYGGLGWFVDHARKPKVSL